MVQMHFFSHTCKQCQGFYVFSLFCIYKVTHEVSSLKDPGPLFHVFQVFLEEQNAYAQ